MEDLEKTIEKRIDDAKTALKNEKLDAMRERLNGEIAAREDDLALIEQGKKPMDIVRNPLTDAGLCPNCLSLVPKTGESQYCGNCGKHLRWVEKKE
jgi:NADH pyrophosphatase NudC (nudix superfamily)